MSAFPQIELQQVAEIIQGGRHKLSGNHFVNEGGFPAFGAGGLNGYLPTAEFDRNAVVLSSIGARCGKCFFAQGQWSSLANTQVILPDEAKVDARFLWYQLNDEKRWPRAGVAQPFIKPSDVKRHLILLPPLDEQKRIAAILDQADALRRKRQSALDRLNQLGQAIFVEMFGDPDQNDRLWPEVEVGSVTDCIVPGRDKPKSFTGGTPWLTTAEIVHLGASTAAQSKLSLSDSEISEVQARVIPENSVVMTCVGDLGKVSVATCPMVINQQLHSFQCKGDVSPFFLMFILSYRQQWMKQMATSTTLPYMNKTICNSIPIFLPPIRLQEQFASAYLCLLEERQTMLRSEQTSASLFTSLQHRAFRGELTGSSLKEAAA